MKEVMAGRQALLQAAHHGDGIAYRFVELLHVDTAFIACLDRLARLRAKLTGTPDTEAFPEFSPTSPRRPVRVRDQYLFSSQNAPGRMYRLVSGLFVPIVMGIRDATMVDEANRGIYASDGSAWTTWEGIGSYDTGEGVSAREAVMQRQELSLLVFRKQLELLGYEAMHSRWR
ncbi:hypothetical protein ANO14919_137610 [Xylariales sp. No.14919]|nr:hypothetical protein ANO14919_137610 [Xylariales sp. No.14919]